MGPTRQWLGPAQSAVDRSQQDNRAPGAHGSATEGWPQGQPRQRRRRLAAGGHKRGGGAREAAGFGYRPPKLTQGVTFEQGLDASLSGAVGRSWGRQRWRWR